MGKTPLGQFVWHEALTNDVEGAKRFYGEVVGWHTAPWGEDGSYHIWLGPDGPVGGCMALPAELRGSGRSPHWLSYGGTPNVDETIAKAKGLGGSVLEGPADIPGAGRYAVLCDPTGAVFGLYSSSVPVTTPNPPNKPGELSWHELATPSPEGARVFYGSLFGWEKSNDYDMGSAGVYTVFTLRGRHLLGMYPQADDAMAPSWLPYANVTSADAAAVKARALGGSIVVEPMDVPGGDRVAVLIDPQGASFGVHCSQR